MHDHVFTRSGYFVKTILFCINSSILAVEMSVSALAYKFRVLLCFFPGLYLCVVGNSNFANQTSLK